MIAARHLFVLALLALGLGGCAREAGEAHAPEPGWAAGWVIPAGEYEYPQKSLKLGSRSRGVVGSIPSRPSTRTRGNVVKP
ncbi:MAG TPA: hypothetical protein VEX18_14165, partial [Polyangiaceae bacterium]|nr:hypothetical protein [Polyangiaceae bacterium]